jgi:GNAT superfamily N-acetyltransferase
MLSYWESRNDEYKESWEIYAFYVLKDYQKQKIWKWLFVEAVNQLINLWYTSMIINVLVWNPAINFYKNYGWVEVWEKTDQCGKIMITEKIMYYKDLKKILENN